MGCQSSYPMKTTITSNAAVKSHKHLISSKENLSLYPNSKIKPHHHPQYVSSIKPAQQNVCYSMKKIQSKHFQQQQTPSIKVFGPSNSKINDVRKSRQHLLLNMDLKQERLERISVPNVRY